MALQKQTIPITLTRGVSTKTDPKSVQAGVPTLENATFISPGRLKKRNGYAQLGSTLASTQAAASYADELLAATKDKLYTYASSTAAFAVEPQTQSQFISATVAKSSIVRNANTQRAQDSAVLNGQIAFAYEDSVSGTCVTIIDQATGKVLFWDSGEVMQVGVGVTKPKLLVLGSQFILLAVVGARLYGAVLTTGGGTMVALTPTAGGRRMISNYDATVIQTSSGARLYVAYNDASVGEVLSTIPLILSNGGISAFYCTAAAPTTPVALGQIAINDPASVINIFADLKNASPVIAYWNNAAVKYRAYNIALTTQLSIGTIETLANVVSISGVSTSATAIAWSVFYSNSAAARYNYQTRINTVAGAGYTVGTATAWVLSVALAGKAFTYNSVATAVVAHQSTLQSTYFVIQAPATTGLPERASYVVAKLLYGVGGGHPSTGGAGAIMLPESNSVDATSWQFSMLEKFQLTTLSGAVFTNTGIDSITLNFFDQQNSYQRAELGNSLHWSGGYVQMFDGANNVEHGFHLFPENVSVPNPGGANSYQYVVCYEWMDNQGQIHRSAPSPVVTQAQGAVISGANPVAVTYPVLRITSKRTTGREPWAVLYRTVNSGTVFFRAQVPQVMGTPFGDTNVINDDTTDANLLGNPQLYTTGGVLENISPNPCTALIVAGNRVWGIDSLTGAIFFSQQVVPGQPVEFSDFLTFNVDRRSGGPTALGVLDEKKIVFRANTISFISGIGPDSLGSQNDLTEYFITSDVGCSNPRSVVTIPAGLMFQSSKGIYLIDRGLNVSYIGADVEAYNASTVTSAVLAPNTTQVRFTLNSGAALVYDYFVGQWSVFTNIAAVDATTYGGQYVYAGATGAFQETPGVYADPGGVFIKLKVVSSWLQFAQMQGFQRIRRLLVLGDWLSSHSLTVKLYFDFATTATQTDTISSTTLVTPLQHRIHLAQQKCEALQVSIEDVSNGTNGESLSLSGLLLEVGVKSGPFRMSAAKSYG